MALTKVSTNLLNTDTVLSVDAIGGNYGSSSSPVTISVTVATKTAAHPYNGDGSSSAYFLDGLESPAIMLNGADDVTADSGYYYKFDQSDSSNSGHPLLFYLDAAKTTAYTTGVTTSGTAGSSGAYTLIDVDSDTPKTIYYQCSSHAYMGNYAVVPASKNFYNLAVGGTTITSTGAELNYVDVTTVGLSQASKSVTSDANGVTSFTKAITEQATALTSGTTVDLNVRDGGVYTITLGHNIGTFNWNNPASSGYASSFTIKVTQDGTGGRTITWPTSVKWASATAPTLSSGANAIDVFTFFTHDAGTAYYGFTAGQVMS